MRFSGKIGKGTVNKRLNFGGDPDPSDTRETALVEVCTVPVLLVLMIQQLSAGQRDDEPI